MRIKSPAFEEGNPIPSIFTCQGDNHNPPLEFFDIPPSVQGLALIVDDPDAATDPKGPGKTFTHWVLWNIPPQTLKIEENTSPEGSEQGQNSGGNVGYTGPCPPTGTHRYFFKLYALNKRLSVSSNITKEELENEISSALVDKAELMGTYEKQQ